MPAHLTARRLVTALFVAAWSGVCLAGGQPPRTQPRSTLTPAQWSADLDFLVSTIKTRHLNPFAHQSAQMFEEKVTTLTRALPGMRDDTARMVPGDAGGLHRRWPHQSRDCSEPAAGADPIVLVRPRASCHRNRRRPPRAPRSTRGPDRIDRARRSGPTTATADRRRGKRELRARLAPASAADAGDPARLDLTTTERELPIVFAATGAPKHGLRSPRCHRARRIDLRPNGHFRRPRWPSRGPATASGSLECRTRRSSISISPAIPRLRRCAGPVRH